jgi:predicted Ser/Thr protein kinase
VIPNNMVLTKGRRGKVFGQQQRNRRVLLKKEVD